jgi:DNA-3-methyladenine glycosylase I
MLRCEWVGLDPLYIEYHDKEWGVPLHDDRKLFEFLVLEGAQAGLKWITVLKKRANYHRSTAGFNPYVISKYQDNDIKRLLADEGIIRNRLKVESSIQNAKAVIEVIRDYGSFNSFLWDSIGDKPIVNKYKSSSEIPPYNVTSEQLSKKLKDRGFNFVGPKIVYSFMQATGLLNDHITSCYRHKDLL